ncbi:type 1 fimbrial protein [Salmonella enterica]|nr:fimbrial protein [Salmonella enterica subsp. enterica serovar Infantis]EHH3361135.1 type 1 fimbrial protein [Salmonella enterica subsp. enterica serovar Sandiego]EJW2053426.1 type 1 fimbrial protein [Salmonella enterica]EKT1767097.1 type 1 fimbrial protein [Salmonella enterica]EKT1775984.1 type 1 fimbrial protein [Salmonella enterica]
MKKSMAGQGVAGALLLAGLMVSAGAMAASGDPVQGGSGTVTINVPIVTSTCSVSVPTEVNFDPTDKNSLTGGKRVVNIKNMDITLSHCSGKTLQMSMRGHAVSPTSDIDGYFSSGDPDNALEYEVLVPMSTEITDGQSSDGSSWYVYLNNTYPLTIKPSSDNYPISFKIDLYSSGNNSTNLGSAVSGGFDYTFTYQ